MNQSESRSGSQSQTEPEPHSPRSDTEALERTCYATKLDDHLHRYFDVLHTTRRTQVATMTIPPGNAAGPPEAHEDADQIFLVLRGRAAFQVWEDIEDDEPRRLEGGEGLLVVVPAGTPHWVASVGEEPLSFVTVYGPPVY